MSETQEGRIKRKIRYYLKQLENPDVKFCEEADLRRKRWKKKSRKLSRVRYHTPDGLILWHRIRSADGKLHLLKRPVLGIYLRTIMAMPRDGKWWRIVDTRGVWKHIRRRRITRIRQIMRELGYLSERVQIIWLPSGLMARWMS